jgi:hypothetical protein
MDSRDRLANLGILASAGIVWLLVALVITTRDPVQEPGAGFVGAMLIGLAVGLTLIPIFWLVVFARHRRIAYHGAWIRAVRRGAWVGIIVALLVVLRIQGLLAWPIALFMIALAAVAESALSAER